MSSVLASSLDVVIATKYRPSATMTALPLEPEHHRQQHEHDRDRNATEKSNHEISSKDSGKHAETPKINTNTNSNDSSVRSANGVARRKRSSHPTVQSVLDQRALQAALDKAGLTVKPIHIQAFYQTLHRLHYPDLADFCRLYYEHEMQVATRSQQQQQQPNYNNNKKSELGENHQDSVLSTKKGTNMPLKNAVSNRKNFNRVQLPKYFLDFLADPSHGLRTLTSTVAKQQTSADGTTTKLAIQLHDDFLVESVLMRYVSVSGSRASLCVSSQCGCAMGCTFCATGTMGLSGNLTSGEILEQVVHANRILAQEWQNKATAPAPSKPQQSRELRLRRLQQHKDKGSSLVSTKEEELPPSQEAEKKEEYGEVLHNHDLVRNIVFMGMGEPLDNYRNVLEACHALLDRKRWNLSHHRVTVSTVGLPHQIRQLTKDLPQVSLALSLHAPNQELRTKIVPTGKVWTVSDLIEALDEHMMAPLRLHKERLMAAEGQKWLKVEFTSEERIQESTRRRAMIEYVMLEGPTSSMECAHELGKLCENRHLIVNLIPYNATNVKDPLKCPSEEHMIKFRLTVQSYGVFCCLRRTMGADIDSACGQLITLQSSQESTSRTSAPPSETDIEDSGSSKIKPSNQRKSTTSRRKFVTNEARDLLSSTSIDGFGDDASREYVLPLAIATALSATAFAFSTAVFLRQRQIKR